LTRDQRGGCLFIGHAASGIEAAPVRFRLSCRTAGTFGRDAKGKAQAEARAGQVSDDALHPPNHVTEAQGVVNPTQSGAEKPASRTRK